MKNLLQDIFVTAHSFAQDKSLPYICKGDDNSYYTFIEVEDFSIGDEHTLKQIEKIRSEYDIRLYEINNQEKEIIFERQDSYGLSDLIEETNKKIRIDNKKEVKKYYLIAKSDESSNLKDALIKLLFIIKKYDFNELDSQSSKLFALNKRDVRKGDVGRNIGQRFTKKDNTSFYFQPFSSSQITWINEFIYDNADQIENVKLLLNSLNLNYYMSNTYSHNTMPIIGIVSNDNSAYGFIDTLTKNAVNSDFVTGKYNLKDNDYINPFDICFGTDAPSQQDINVIKNYISYFLGRDIEHDQIKNMIEKLYRSKKYCRTHEYRSIKHVLEQKGIHNEEISWRTLRNILASEGSEIMALFAHKQSMPTMNDFRDMVAEKAKRNGGYIYTGALEKIDEVMRHHGFVNRATTINSERRESITHINLGINTDTVMADFAYMVASNHLYKEMIVNNKDYISAIHEDCKNIALKRMSTLSETPKRLVLDDLACIFKKERHEDLIVSITEIARESRKWQIDVNMVLEHCSLDSRIENFVTSSFTTSRKDYEVIYNRSASAVSGITETFEGWFETREGIINNTLDFNLTPVEYWAITGVSEEISLRNALYDVLKGDKARAILAEAYPYGLKEVLADKSYSEKDVVEALLK